MEGDAIQRQVSKFQKISCNGGGSIISDTCSNPNYKIATEKGNHLFPAGWPASRIVRVSRASGGKDRHSKVLTSKGLRDRRIRLSVTTAIEFYDLQDRLGYDQPSKAVEWLIKAASTSIDELPSLHPSFPGTDDKSTGNDGFDDTDFEVPNHHRRQQQHQQNNDSNNNSNSNNNNACSSTSETGSGLSLSRSENRIRARERARDLAAKKEMVKESGSSFTDLLTGGFNTSNNNTSNHLNYFQMSQFNIPTGDNQLQHPQHHHRQHHLSFLEENFAPVVSSGEGGLGSGLNRGTLQSNLLSTLPHNSNHQLQRFQSSSMVDGSTSANFPFFIGPTISSGAPDHFQAIAYDSQRLQLYGGSDHYKEKSRN